MSAGKKFSNSIVYTSVFFGSILGAGISLVARPDSRSELRDVALDSVREASRSVIDTLRHGRTRTAEIVTLSRTRAALKLERLDSMAVSLRDNLTREYYRSRNLFRKGG